jgi:hypothetical protein
VPPPVVAVGQPPVPPPVVAVGQPPVPTAVASQPVTLVQGPIVERPGAIGLVGDTARAVAARIERLSAHL